MSRRVITRIELLLVDKAITLYSDGELAVNDCIEEYLLEDCKFHEDAAFNLSLELTDLWMEEKNR